MALDFPNSPTVGQTYTYGDRTWTWNGTTWSLSGTGSGSPSGDGATGPTGPTGPAGPPSSGASSVAGTASQRDLALNNALSSTEMIIENPDPGIYDVANDPWPFAALTNFTPGSRYLWRDVTFRVDGQAPTDVSQWNRAVKVEATLTYAKSELTAIGGTIFTDSDYMGELSTNWSLGGGSDKRNWHDNAGVEVDVEDFTLIGTTIYNVGDGVTAGISTDPTPDVLPKRLKVIGVAFDAPDDFVIPGEAPTVECGSRTAWVHDDAFELDTMEDTLIDDCMVNGAYVCVSIRNDAHDATDDYRSRTITIRNSLFRVAPIYEGHDTVTYGHWVHGPWFKTTDNPAVGGYRPNLVIEDCVFFAPGDGGMLPEWNTPFDLPVNQGGGQIVSAENITIIWPNEPFPYRTHWDAYGTNITYIDDISLDEAMAEWNTRADEWRARHVPLDTGRAVGGGGGVAGATGPTGPASTAVGGTGATGPAGATGAGGEGSGTDLAGRIDVTANGAVADAVLFSGGSINAGSNSLTGVANAASSWIGKSIIVAGASVSSANLYTTVSNVVGTTVTLDATAGTARTGGTAYGICGTDSTTAFAVSVTAARAAGTAAFVPPTNTAGFLLTGSIFRHDSSRSRWTEAGRSWQGHGQGLRDEPVRRDHERCGGSREHLHESDYSGCDQDKSPDGVVNNWVRGWRLHRHHGFVSAGCRD